MATGDTPSPPEAVDDLDTAVRSLVAQPYLPKRQLEFSTNIESGERVTTTRTIPDDGYITGVFLSVPDGVNNNIGIGIDSETQRDRIFPANPEDDFFAFNNVTRQFDTTARVAENDDLTAVFDSVSDYGHFINLVVTVVNTEPLTGGER